LAAEEMQDGLLSGWRRSCGADDGRVLRLLSVIVFDRCCPGQSPRSEKVKPLSWTISVYNRAEFTREIAFRVSMAPEFDQNNLEFYILFVTKWLTNHFRIGDWIKILLCYECVGNRNLEG
jgi:hypothetical protein